VHFISHPGGNAETLASGIEDRGPLDFQGFAEAKRQQPIGRDLITATWNSS